MLVASWRATYSFSYMMFPAKRTDGKMNPGMWSVCQVIWELCMIVLSTHEICHRIASLGGLILSLSGEFYFFNFLWRVLTWLAHSPLSLCRPLNTHNTHSFWSLPTHQLVDHHHRHPTTTIDDNHGSMTTTTDVNENNHNDPDANHTPAMWFHHHRNRWQLPRPQASTRMTTMTTIGVNDTITTTTSISTRTMTTTNPTTTSIPLWSMIVITTTTTTSRPPPPRRQRRLPQRCWPRSPPRRWQN